MIEIVEIAESRLKSLGCSKDLSRTVAECLLVEGGATIHWNHSKLGLLGMAIGSNIPLGKAMEQLEENPDKFGGWHRSWKQIK